MAAQDGTRNVVLFRAQLQWHKHCMTSPAEHSNRIDVTSGFRGWLLALGVSLATSLLVIAPFFWMGNASGHDFGFHAASWLDVAGQWKEGIFFPRWTEWANHGFGESRFIFYPPLSWMLGAALSFVAPWNAVPGVFIVIVQTMAGICAFALARRFLPKNAALFSAACYVANPYALVIVYMRSDFAEQLACALTPLLVLTTLQLCGVVENRRRLWPRSMGFFAVVFAAVWLSNAPAAVVASYSVALIFAWAVFEKKSLRPLWRGAGGLALGFGLAGFYLLPAAYEQRWVNIGQALSSGLLPSENFLFTQIADVEHTWFNWISSLCALTLILLTALTAFASRRFSHDAAISTGAKPLWGSALLVLGSVATVMMLRLKAPLWNLLPKMRFVQFPWRWMSIVAVVCSCFLASAIERRRGWLWFVLVAILSFPVGYFLTQNTWWDPDEMSTQLT